MRTTMDHDRVRRSAVFPRSAEPAVHDVHLMAPPADTDGTYT
jgi:hypothetical protein